MTSRLVDYKPALTDGYGRTRKQFASDAPKGLSKLALTQAPTTMRGNAQRGAWARGWCDGVRRRSVSRNPYQRAGAGFHHGMAHLYRAGWRAGRDVYDVATATVAPSAAEFHRRRELRERVLGILAGRP